MYVVFILLQPFVLICADSTSTSPTVYVSSIAAPRQARVCCSDVLKNCSFKFGTDDKYKFLPNYGVRNTTSTNFEIIFDLQIFPPNYTFYYNMSCDTNNNVTFVIQGTFQSSEVLMKISLCFPQRLICVFFCRLFGS